jgi:hypothetical protein
VQSERQAGSKPSETVNSTSCKPFRLRGRPDVPLAYEIWNSGFEKDLKKWRKGSRAERRKGSPLFDSRRVIRW